MTTSHPGTPPLTLSWVPLIGRIMEFLWLLTLFLVPLMFVSPGLMANGFDVPKVTLYRSLVELMCALWIIEGGLAPPTLGKRISRLSPGFFKEWLRA